MHCGGYMEKDAGHQVGCHQIISYSHQSCVAAQVLAQLSKTNVVHECQQTCLDLGKLN